MPAMPDRPAVQCGNCGAEIRFEDGQLVGDPAAVAEVERLKREAGRWRKESEIWRNRYYKLRSLINQAVTEINQRMGPRPDGD